MHHKKAENGSLITDRGEIANTLGKTIEKSSSENYPNWSNLSTHKRKSKRPTLKQTETFVILRSFEWEIQSDT